MEPESYEITLIPFQSDGRVFYHGKEYTSAAQKHNIEINGTRFYIRENGNAFSILGGVLDSNLPRIFSNRTIDKPIHLSISLEERE